MSNKISDSIDRLTTRQITLRSKNSSVVVDVNDSGELDINSTKNTISTIVIDRLKFKDGTYIDSNNNIGGGVASISLLTNTTIFKYSGNGTIISGQFIELKVVKSSNISANVVFTFSPNPTNDIQLEQINSTTWKLIPLEFEKAGSDILEITATAGAYSSTVKIYKVRDGDTGPVGPTGAQGPAGSAGIDAKAVKLSIDDAQIAYLSNGTNPTPTQITVTATAQNHSAGAVFYEFAVYEEGQQSGTTLVNTTSNTIILTNTSKNYGSATYTFINSTKDAFKSKTIKVVTREGQSNSSPVAEDSLPIIATKDGSDVLEVNFPNNNHTFPSDKDGNITAGDYVGGGSIVEAYIGNEQLTPTTNASLTNGLFKVEVQSRRDIVEGSTTIDLGTKRVILGDPSNMSVSANTAEIVYLISGKDSRGVSKSKTIKASFTKSKKGENGQTGPNGADGTDGRDTASIFDFYSTYQYNSEVKVPYGWNITPSSSVALTSLNYLNSPLTPKFEPSGGFKYPELTGSGYEGKVDNLTRGLTILASSESIYGGNVANFCIQSISLPAGRNEAYAYTAEPIPVSEGNTYELSFRIKQVTDNISVDIGLFFFDENGNLIVSTNTNTSTITYAQTSFPHVNTNLPRKTTPTWTADKVISYYSFESGGSLKTFPSTAKYAKPYVRIKFVDAANSLIMRQVLIDYLYFGVKTTPNKRNGIFIDEITGRVSIGESNADIAGSAGGLTATKYDSFANFEIVSSNSGLEPQDVCDIKITRAHAYSYTSASNGPDVAIGRDFAALRFAGWTGTFLGNAQSNMVIDERAEIRATYNRTGSRDVTYGALGGASLDFYTSPSRTSVLLNNTDDSHTKPTLRARISDQGQFLIGYSDSATQVNPSITITNGGSTLTFNSSNINPKLAVNGNIYGKAIILEPSVGSYNILKGGTYVDDLYPIGTNAYLGGGAGDPFYFVYAKNAQITDTFTACNTFSVDANKAIFLEPVNLTRGGFIEGGFIGDLLIKQPDLSPGTNNGNNNTNAGILMQRNSSTSNNWRMFINDNADFCWSYTQDVKGYVSNGAGGGSFNFTGQHRNIPNDNIDYIDKIGLIVVSSGEYASINSNSITINESLPKVELSSKRNQKNVFGVISDKEDENKNTREYAIGNFISVNNKPIGDNRLIINSIGEGAIWVCNINGNLENGDYITTCEIPGYGMKQDDDLLHNYTVAKITCDCDFNLESPIYMCEEFEFSGSIYRKAFVGCTYHCG